MEGRDIAEPYDPFRMTGKLRQGNPIQHLYGPIATTGTHDGFDGWIPQGPEQVRCPFIGRPCEAVVILEGVGADHGDIAPLAESRTTFHHRHTVGCARRRDDRNGVSRLQGWRHHHLAPALQDQHHGH